MSLILVGSLVRNRNHGRIAIVEDSEGQWLKIRYLTRFGYSMLVARLCQNTIRRSHLRSKPVMVKRSSVDPVGMVG